MNNLLLTNGVVVTVDGDRRIIENGAVAVSGSRIVDVGPADALAGRHATFERIDCSGKAVIPGLIDAHGHGGHSLIKMLAADMPALWMRIVTPAYFSHTTPAFWYADGLLAAAERLRAGVTCGASVLASMPRSDEPSFAIEHARAYAEAGMRQILCVGPAGLPWPRKATRWIDGNAVEKNVTFDEMIAGTEAIIQSCDGSADGRIRVFVTPFTIVPSVDPSNPSTPDIAVSLTPEDRLHARAVRELARKWGVRIHSDAFGGMIRMAVQDKENALLGPDVHLQHCIGISLEEVELLAGTGTHVTHSPGGRAPVIEMMSRGLNVAATSDGSSPCNGFDLLQAARQIRFAHQLLHNDLYLLPPGKMLEMITIDAARAIGLEHEIGSIEIGKKADLAIVDLRQPHLTPNWLVVHRLILEAVGHDVETVLVDGRIVMKDRKLCGVDLGDSLVFAQEQADAYIDRANLRRYLCDPGWGMISRSFNPSSQLS